MDLVFGIILMVLFLASILSIIGIFIYKETAEKLVILETFNVIVCLITFMLGVFLNRNIIEIVSIIFGIGTFFGELIFIKLMEEQS